MKLKNFLTAAVGAYIGVLIAMPNLYNDARMLLLCTFIGLASAYLEYVCLEDLNKRLMIKSIKKIMGWLNKDDKPKRNE